MSSPAPGDIIDARYELRREIGRGGMGSVFEAQHRHTGRTVAIKLLHGEYSHVPEVRERLLREAHVLGAVCNPGVVEVYDAGVDPEGRPYVVLEMLQGRALEGILAARGTLTVEDTVLVGRQVCDALAVVHARGVVHRDVKPGNVFLVRDAAGREVVKLVDFGVAAVPDALPAPTRRKLTAIGAVVGTAEYMSLDQLLARPVDARADQYALAVTLFECLMGEVPYPGEMPQVLAQLARGAPPPSVRARRPEVPEALEAALARALASDAGARFPDIGAFGAALGAATRLGPAGHSSLLGLHEVAAAAAAQTAEGTAVQEPGAPLTRRKHTPPIALQRRRSPRVPYVTPVQVLGHDDVVAEARSEEVSEAGMLLLTEASYAVGDRVFARFALPGSGAHVAIESRVHWVRPARGRYAVGLEFRTRTPELRDAIARYVTALATPGTR